MSDLFEAGREADREELRARGWVPCYFDDSGLKTRPAPLWRKPDGGSVVEEEAFRHLERLRGEEASSVPPA